MAQTRDLLERIVILLRQIEVAVANGKKTPTACRESGIGDVEVLMFDFRFGQASGTNRPPLKATCLNKHLAAERCF
jgi:hypothetical protein